MANKFVRVNINHKGFIPILGCFGPVRNILLTEIQINNIKRIIGDDKIELVNKPKKVISPKQAEELRRGKVIEEQPKVEEVKQEPQPEPVEIEEPKVEEVPAEETKPEEVQVEEQPKPAPRRRGGRKPAAKKVEEAPAEESVVEE